MNRQNLFNNSNISEKDFLKNYWHKKPVLLRNAINLKDLSVIPNKMRLQALSGNEDIQSRIVLKHSESQYDVEYGPFEKDDWANLTHSCWNLLVSDIDKWQPESKEILNYFNFIRNWIFDDIMVSCGSIDGTVGPHTDHYDVFLVQVHGKRSWSYTNYKLINPELMPEQALKLMSEFNADESQILNPGDVLYLPPEVAHYGIATTDDCVTCSIGVRTPSHAELLTSFVDGITKKLSENNRFEEPDFKEQPISGQITKSDLSNVSQIIQDNLNVNEQNISHWFGKYITEYRSLFYEFNQYQDIQTLDTTKDLKPSPFTKSCYFLQNKKAQLFVNGNEYQPSVILAQQICDVKILKSNSLQKLSKVDMSIVKELYSNGSFINS